MTTPELSIIIPVLDEADALPRLLGDIASQQGVVCEVIVSDGGSTDGTVEVVCGSFSSGRLNGLLLEGPRGRGRQLNSGAASATAPWLLFLHADSRLPDPQLLRHGLDTLRAASATDGDQIVAGRFALRFDGERHPAAFFEAKARLGRPGCIHGDQGMLVARRCFDAVGPFREDLPVMEDTSLAEKIRQAGRWLLLPGEVVTSARRFELEGWRERQRLNAVLLNCLRVGWTDFLVQAPDVYRQQALAGPLRLSPFLRLADDLLARLPEPERRRVWRETGRHVRDQVWQLGLLLDYRRARRHPKAGFDPGCWLAVFDRVVDPLTDHAAGRLLSEWLVKIWFRWNLNHDR